MNEADVDVYRNRAMIHVVKSQFEMASADYDKIVELRPGDPYVLGIRARYHSLGGIRNAQWRISTKPSGLARIIHQPGYSGSANVA
ncbi:MAG: hypothetical protein EBU23_18515 [Mycobacteriaceae bacterium]|nr:hypothetical protein [Mycobacteriaceae bacterium]